MCLTSKHFNWTSHYKNPDGPCSVQASGGLQHVTMCKMHHPLPPPGLHRGLSDKIPQAGKIWILQSLRDSGRFQGMLEGFGTVIPSFLKTESMQSKNHSVCAEARDPDFRGHRAELPDLQLEKISSINWTWPKMYSPPGSHQARALVTLVALLLVQTFAFERWFYCPVAAWCHPAHGTMPWCPKK